MDDITIITISIKFYGLTTMTTAPRTKRLLTKLNDNLSTAKMKVKSSKSRSISIVKGFD